MDAKNFAAIANEASNEHAEHHEMAIGNLMNAAPANKRGLLQRMVDTARGFSGQINAGRIATAIFMVVMGGFTPQAFLAAWQFLFADVPNPPAPPAA